jgi:hypothetical protein
MRPSACSLLALVVVVCSSTRAFADAPAAATWDGNAPQAAPSVAPIGATPYGVNPLPMMIYDGERKSPPIALLLELLFPGVGSVYAGHAVGALVTLGLVVGGSVIIVWDFASNFDIDGPSRGLDPAPLLIGLGMVLAGRIYGFVDSYSSCTSYNRALAQRLGLPGGVALDVAPIRMDQNVAWGPALSLSF